MAEKPELSKVCGTKTGMLTEATAPDGRALRFNADGSRLIGFREPPIK
ncbi:MULTISPECIES: hypothetical protein [Rahnella]|jgi:hypothetical protein